jgi:hypothetical protein
VTIGLFVALDQALDQNGRVMVRSEHPRRDPHRTDRATSSKKGDASR